MEPVEHRGGEVRTRSWLAIFLVISVVLRIAAAFYLGDQVVDLPGTTDQISYHTLAQRILDGKGFTFPTEWWPVTAPGAPTAHWSFIYTFYLIAIYALFGIHPILARIIQALVVGLLHPWLAYQIGRHTFGPAVGLAAAAITAGYAYFIYYAGTLMTEPFYITFILASLYFAIRMAERSALSMAKAKGQLWTLAVLLGVALSATLFLRQLFILIIPFIFLWVLWAGGRSRVAPLLLSGTIIIASIIPFTLFNYARFHRFVLLNTNAGYAFYLSNHPYYGSHFVPILPSEMYIRLIPPELRILDEAALDQELLKRGINFVLQDPGRYLSLSISRIPAYFMFWPSYESGLVSNLARVSSFGLFFPFMIYGIVRTLKNSLRAIGESIKEPSTLLFVFILIYSIIHLLTWALIRYRLPVDAVSILFAGVAFVDLYGRLFSPREAAQMNEFPGTP